MYDVSIISVNYNSSDDTLKMIDSIKDKTSLNYEIIIVDNNSRIEEFKKLKNIDNADNIKLIRSKLNLGFSGGNMLGVEASSSSSKYFFFLNNDTTFLNNTLEILYKNCEEDSSIGLIAPQQFDENNQIISSFRYFPSVSEKFFGKKMANFLSGNKRYNNKVEYNSVIEVGIVSGATMFFKRESFLKTKGFDTNFFLYCEEEDISKRVWDTGYKVCFNSSAKLIHFCGKSTERNFEIEREVLISYFRLLNKHCNFYQKILLKLHIFIKFFLKRNRSEENRKLFNFIMKPNKDSYSLKHIQKASHE